MYRGSLFLLLLLSLSGCVAITASGSEGDADASNEADDEEADDEEADDDETDDEPEDVPEGEPEDPDDDDPTATTIFVPETDLAIGCECDPFAQDCPEGEKCVAYSSTGGEHYDANHCVAITDDGVAGERCTSGGVSSPEDTCDAHSVCFGLEPFEEQWQGTCRSFCQGTADDPQCPADHTCVVGWEGSVNLCLPSCDPLLQDCADEGYACQWANSSFACLLANPLGTAAKPCDYFDDCAAGMFCAPAEVLPACEGAACCTSYCELEAEDPQCESMPGSVCTPFFEAGDPGPLVGQVGVCVAP